METRPERPLRPKFLRTRWVLGHILPSVDPVISTDRFWEPDIAQWRVVQTRVSGRANERFPDVAPGNIMVPTAEFTDPYGPEDFKRWKEQGVKPQIPPTPQTLRDDL